MHSKYHSILNQHFRVSINLVSFEGALQEFAIPADY